jgi:hypothetical protein
MTETPRQSLSPGYWVLRTRSRFAPHAQTIPTRLPTFTSFGIENVSYTDWTGGTVAAADMLTAYLAKLADCHPDTTSFDTLEIYSQPTTEDFPQLIAVEAIGTVGADETTGWDEAVQVTLTGKDTNGNDSRLILLDVHTNNSFGRFSLAAITLAYRDLWGVIADEGNAFSSRKGFRPDALIQQSVTLNEKLRREYHLN